MDNRPVRSSSVVVVVEGTNQVYRRKEDFDNQASDCIHFRRLALASAAASADSESDSAIPFEVKQVGQAGVVAVAHCSDEDGCPFECSVD